VQFQILTSSSLVTVAAIVWKHDLIGEYATVSTASLESQLFPWLEAQLNNNAPVPD